MTHDDATYPELTEPEALLGLEACRDIRRAPPDPGVYVLSKGSEILYIGQATNLWRRLNNHERSDLFKSSGVECRIVRCGNHKEVEKWLISALKPSHNGISEMPRRNIPMKIILKSRHRSMLEELARLQRRSMNQVIGLAIERVYEAERQRAEATGRARAIGSASGRSD